METPQAPGRGHAIQVSGEKGQHVTFAVSGRIALDNLPSVIFELQERLQKMVPATLTVDLAGVERSKWSMAARPVKSCFYLRAKWLTSKTS